MFIHDQVPLVMIIPDNEQYTLYKLSCGGNCKERKVAEMVVVVRMAVLWLFY